MLTLSLSAVRQYRTCEQSYAYRHIDHIQRTERAVYITIGLMVHEYLEGYYNRLKAGASAGTSHVESFVTMRDKWQPSLQRDFEAAVADGNEKRAAELNNAPPSVRRIIMRYFKLRGRADAEDFEVLVVEDHLALRIASGIRSVSVIDLITRHKLSGRVALWEHKSVQSVPDNDLRLRDLQTVLYRRLAEQRYGLTIDQVRWNYLRTKEPVVPDRLKSGQLTKRQDLDTTWEVYSETLREYGLDEAAYQDVRERLLNREEEAYFPRFDLPYLADANLLLTDYQASAQMIQARRLAWQRGKARPIRNFGFHCGWCEYNPLCKAVLMGGDTEDVLRLKYRHSWQGSDQNGASAGSADTSKEPVAVGAGGDPGWDSLLSDLSAWPGGNEP